MKNFNLLRKSERKSVGTTLALTVGSPSVDRRGTMLKHYAFMLLFLLGSLNVWGTEVEVISTLNLSATTQITNQREIVSGVLYISGAKNNANQAPTFNYNATNGTDLRLYRLASGKTTGYSTFTFSVADGYKLNGIVFKKNSTTASSLSNISAGTGTLSGNSWKPTENSTTQSVTFTYNVKNSGSNFSGQIFQIYVTYSSTGGGSKPTVYIDPEELTFTTVGVGDDAPAAKTFTITGSNMTEALSLGSLTNFTTSVTDGSLSPSEGSISATVTVTPKSGFTTNAEDKSETLTISGDDLDDDIELALNAEVKAKHNIIFDTDLKSIANVSVMEGETYDITETIEAALIASCTYTKFEGWTTATSIADASVKPSLVSSVTMSTTDVTLKPVFSKTIGGGGSSEVTITPSGISGTGDPYTITHDQTAYTIQANKNNGSTAPAWNGTAGDIRVYAKGTVVISNSSAMSRIVFNLSAKGLERLAPISASAGTIATQASGDETVVWTGNETSVTFTVGDKADYGSDGSTKAGQLCFSTITATTGGGGTTTYSLDPGCAAAGQCYAPTFSPAAGTFDVAQNVELACATDGADIYYTLNGGTPTSSSTKYTSAIHVTQNTIIKAIAIKDGMTDSEIAEGEFNIRCAQPTFSPAGGDYDVAQNVTISAAGADHIYYTLNGNDPVPSEEGTSEYTAAISINTTGSHTIKAIAVKDGYANSNVASATYVMDLPYANIAAFIAAKPATAKSLTLNNAIITGVDGTTLYVQDETAGIMIYGLTSLPENAAPNHSISGTIKGAYKLFKNQHELVKPDKTTPIDMSGVTISAGEVARPAINEYTSLSAAYAAKPMMLVTLKGVNYDGTQYDFDGNKIYNTFDALTDKTMPETTVNCDITGVVINYNGTLELLPVFATDIVADADAAAPVFTPAGGATEGEAVQVDLNSYVSIAPADANHSVNITSAQITTTEPMSVTAVSSRDFYRNTSVTKWYYGNSASASYDINGQGSTPQGTIVAKVNDEIAASAKENDEVHVFITPEAHFALNTITVNGNVPTTESAGTEYSFTMPGEAVTIAVTWTEDAKATLTFAKGDADGEEAAPENIVDYIGETVQLPANPFTYKGHKFAGWSCDGGTTKLAAGANYVLAEDKAFVAQWDEIPTFDNSGYEWQLVTSDAQLVAGKYYVMASTAKGKVAGAISSDILGTVSATIADGAIAYNAFGTDQTADAASAVVFELGGTTGAWTLNEAIDELGQLAYKGNKTVKWETESTAAWAITIADNNATLVPAAANTYHMLYNVSSPRFTIYTSDPAANMLLPQLYVWAEKVYKLRYDANGGENAPAAQAADGEGKATVTDVKPTYTDHIFNGWNTLVGGNGEAKAAGDVIDLSAGDVTLYAQWREPNTYSISYDANGGTLIDGKSEITPNPTSVTEGNAYTIEENVYEVEGKLFIGWKANGVTYNAGQEIYPTENMTFVAQWGDPNVTDFMLVTDVKQLKDGDKVYIVAAEHNVAMGTQNDGNYRNYVEIAKQNNRVVILNATPVEFTVGKVDDNFTFNDGTGYLYASSSDKNYLITKDVLDDNGKWAITINANGVASIIAQGANKNNNLKWNNSSPRFSCYKSGQKAVSIYKRPDYSRNVSGNYATICLPKAGKIIGATLYEIAYYGGASKKIFFDEIVNGEMKAGIPYIFQPAAGVEKINVYYSDNTAENVGAGNRNGLIGFYNLNDPAARHDIDQDAGYYILYNNQYWLVSGRAAYVENYRAYIRLADITPSEPTLAPGRRRISMSVNDTQTTTGFENAELINGENDVQKVLINGELFILRGEKMYDAKGQLVK